MYVTIDLFVYSRTWAHGPQVWVSLTAYLQFVCLQPSASPVPRSEIIGKFCRANIKSILTISSLAAVFSPVLLRDPEPLSAPPILTPLQKRRFLGYFLV